MRTATKLRFLGIAAALAAAPALASGFPVPSFNDVPELYGPQAARGSAWQTGGAIAPHPYPSLNDAGELHPQAGDRASAGASRDVQPGGTQAPFVPYGPWITLPSSGS